MKPIFRSFAVLQGLLLLATVHPGHAQSSTYPSKNKEQHMNTQAKNKETVRHMYEDILNTGRLDLLGEVFSEDYTGNAGERGPEGAAASVGAVLKGFPDIKWKIEDMIAEGDRVVVRWIWNGTHTGGFQGLTPGGQSIRNSAIAIYQLTDAKIVKAWMQTDRLGFLQQVGLAPKELGTFPADKK